ncbi:hypothetical protein NLM16_35945 [Bradyrhizobium brasilense]|uniref:hypothetical protein n=1 Tax=Bradyrhizobium brasilense TaxID=1419277 RepID=UPI002877D538|nr:hypothetical protein [Bradyrhizobium brasilense]MCP3419512.1 hypothetical protein [Bradyrhizobium brasilense]
MRAGRLFAVLLIAVLVGIAASWVTYRHDYVVHERAGAEWAALTLTDQALGQIPQPQDADAAVFFSNAVIDKALKQLAGTTIGPVKSKLGDLVVTVEDARVQPGLGFTGAVIDVKVASTQRSLAVDLKLEGDLSFRGIAPQAGDKPTATAEFAVGVTKVEPQFNWGFLDIRGRNFLSEAISSGLMIALDNHLTVAVPFEDRIGFNTGFKSDTTVKAPDGTVTLNMSLPDKVLEQRFSFSAPVFLRSGVWLLAATSASGQAPVTPPAVPDLQPSELESRIAMLREHVSGATKDWGQEGDFALLLSGKALVGFVGKLSALPGANRTVVVHSTGVTGHLVDNETILLELPDATDINATMTVGPPSAVWTPAKGVAIATDLRMDLHAKVHAHVKPVVNMGTVLGLEGGTGKHVSGTVELANKNVDGHSILSLGVTMPCDTVTADVTTDGRLVAGPVKVDLVKVGVRWTMPVPPTLGEPNLVMDDLPRRAALRNPKPDDHGITVTPAHKAIEYVVHVTDAKATQNGYIVNAKLDMNSVDAAELPPEIIDQRHALADSVKAASRAAAACPSVDPDMKVLFGGAEFGKNNEIVKAFTNALHDLEHGPGPNNDIVRNLDNAKHDLEHGPGPNNEIRKLGRRLGL